MSTGTGKLINAVGFVLSLIAMGMFEMMESSGAFSKGAFGLALIVVVAGIVLIVVGLAKSYDLNQ